jgi:exonuclease-1
MAAGNTAAALECYQRAVDVTPAMARQVMDTLTAAGVDFLVAPYEADAQVGLGPGS